MELVSSVRQLASRTYDRNEDNLMAGLPGTNPALWLGMVVLFVSGALPLSNSAVLVQTTATSSTRKASDTANVEKVGEVTGKVWYQRPNDRAGRFDSKLQDATIPVLEEISEPASSETGQEAPARPPAMLPKTGSPVPLIGFSGLFAVAVAFTIRVLRTR